MNLLWRCFYKEISFNNVLNDWLLAQKSPMAKILPPGDVTELMNGHQIAIVSRDCNVPLPESHAPKACSSIERSMNASKRGCRNSAIINYGVFVSLNRSSIFLPKQEEVEIWHIEFICVVLNGDKGPSRQLYNVYGDA